MAGCIDADGTVARAQAMVEISAFAVEPHQTVRLG
jgi:hypothetical protein